MTEELNKYRAIILATLDYQIGKIREAGDELLMKSIKHLENIKQLAEVHYQKGHLDTLKKGLRDLTEWPLEEGDRRYVDYIRVHTGYEFDIFADFENRIQKIIDAGKIESTGEFYYAALKLKQIKHIKPGNEMASRLEKLITEFEERQ
jgi:hypothetical protein